MKCFVCATEMGDAPPAITTQVTRWDERAGWTVVQRLAHPGPCSETAKRLLRLDDPGCTPASVPGGTHPAGLARC